MRGKKITNDIFLEELYAKNKNIIATEKYKNANSKIVFKCLLCEAEFTATPHNILQSKICCKNCKDIGLSAHGRFLEKVSKKFPKISVLSTYVDKSTKIKFKCLDCGHEFEILPQNLLASKYGCSKCADKAISEQLSMSHEDFVDKINEINPNIEILTRLNGVNNDITCRCKIDGNIWSTQAKHILYDGSNCPKCSRKTANTLTTKSHDEFVEELRHKNKNLRVIGKYINAHTKIKFECLVCGELFEAQPSNILNSKYGCVKCANTFKKTHEDFLLTIQNNDIEVLDEYVNNKTKIRYFCKQHNYNGEALPSSFRNKYLCPICAGIKSKTTEEFKEEMRQINGDIEIIGEYINNYTKIKCFCKIHNVEFSTKPTHLLENVGCPICNKSKGEKEIAKILNLHSVDFIPQQKYENLLGTGGGLLSYDFYLPKYNLLIEYQGQFHDGNITGNYQTEEMLQIQQEHDRRKKQYAKENNIELLEIWYWDYKNIEQILESRLLLKQSA